MTTSTPGPQRNLLARLLRLTDWRGVSTVDAPHLVNIVVGGKTPMVPTKELGDMGFSLVLYANVALQAAVQGMTLALRALKDGGDVGETSGLVTSFANRQSLVKTQALNILSNFSLYSRWKSAV